MQARFVKGNVETIRQESASAISAGDVLANGNGVAISHADFKAADDQGNFTSELAIDGGQYDFAKDASSGPVFAVGDNVFWDDSANEAVTAGSLYVGKCTVAAGASDATVRAHHICPDGKPS